jgi:16S rRNA (cytosine967-C5)-methyltransferase
MPDYASVSSIVDLAKNEVGGWSSGVVNGVLRNVERFVDGPHPEPTGDPWLPLPDGGGWTLSENIWSDADRLAEMYSYPDLVMNRWIRQYGSEQAESIAAAGNVILPVTLRINPLRSNVTDVLAGLQEAGIDAASGPERSSIRVNGGGRVEGWPGFKEGYFSVQDETAMRPVNALDPRRGERILDMCASPGGKTAQIAERMKDSGAVIAVDVKPQKIVPIAETAERLGLKSIQAGAVDATSLTLKAWNNLAFDAILLDAPCSNTGVVSRRPEVRWRLTPEDFASVGRLQEQLLDRAAALVRPEGRIVYSTCSIEYEENEGQIEAFVAQHPGWTCTEQELRLPTQEYAGGFYAKLERG